MFAYMHYFTVDNYARSLTRARRSVLARARLQGYLHDCRSRQAMCTPLPPPPQKPFFYSYFTAASSTPPPPKKQKNFQITSLKNTLQTTIKLQSNH